MGATGEPMDGDFGDNGGGVDTGPAVFDGGRDFRFQDAGGKLQEDFAGVVGDGFMVGVVAVFVNSPCEPRGGVRDECGARLLAVCAAEFGGDVCNAQEMNIGVHLMSKM